MGVTNILIKVGRAAYRYRAFRRPFNAACSRAAAHEVSAKTLGRIPGLKAGAPLLSEDQHLRLRLVLSNNPLWNNTLMQTVYREGPHNKNTIGYMQILTVKEPIKDYIFKQVAKIKPDSIEEKTMIKELDAIVSSMATYTCDGITTFAELFEGKFTQPPKMTGGFRQFVSPLIMAFMSEYIRTEMPEFYEEQMWIAAKAFKAMEVLSRD